MPDGGEATDQAKRLHILRAGMVEGLVRLALLE